MSSDKIDAWVRKNPTSWAKLADTKKKKLTFEEFKKHFKQGAKKQGKYNAIKNMTNAQIKEIYNSSDKTTKQQKPLTTETLNEKAYQPKTITITRGNKTYKKTVTTHWPKQTDLALKIASNKKPRTKEYNEIIETLVKTTGRTRLAVTTKVRRTRKAKK